MSLRALLGHPKIFTSLKTNYVASLQACNGAVKRLERNLHSKPVVILGIESSCDDTACGIVDQYGNILGEAINSQQDMHIEFGGIIPTFACKMHKANITDVCERALRSANMRVRDVDAIATTVKPGLIMSLNVGTQFGKYLSRVANKPFIPIHHMEAHALTARMIEKVDFPYLVLLISGGHCLLAIVQDVDKFYLLGSTRDNAPGELIDKVSRKLKLKNIPEFCGMSGGQALEEAARKATVEGQFLFAPVMTYHYNCEFSFSGLTSRCLKFVEEEERKYNVIADMVIPTAYNLCADFQMAFVRHVCQRTQRAMEFIDKLELFPEGKRTLVASGGVASNNLLAEALGIVSSELNFRFVRTPARLCTDNGVMIAWNGVERWQARAGVITEREAIERVSAESKVPLGEDWSKRVEELQMKCQWVPFQKKLTSNRSQ